MSTWLEYERGRDARLKLLLTLRKDQFNPVRKYILAQDAANGENEIVVCDDLGNGYSKSARNWAYIIT